MRGNALVADMKRKETAIEAISLFERALALDPHNVGAMIGIATTRTSRVCEPVRDRRARGVADPRLDILIARAIVLAPDHIGVRRARAVLLRASGRFMEAIIAAQSVIALNPGEPTAYRELGLNNLYLGSTREAAEWFRRADHIAPLDRSRWTWLQGLGRAQCKWARMPRRSKHYAWRCTAIRPFPARWLTSLRPRPWSAMSRQPGCTLPSWTSSILG